jgi:hypothetical protein
VLDGKRPIREGGVSRELEWIGDPYRDRERAVRGVDPIRRSALKEGIKVWKNAKGKVRPDGAMLAITRYFADIQIVYS